MNSLTAKSIGWMLVVSLILSLLSEAYSTPSYWAGIPIWIAALLLFVYISPSQKLQLLCLFIIGSTCLFIGVAYEVREFVYSAVAANEKVVTMLIAVGFLRIVAIDTSRSSNLLPVGKKSLVITLFGAHLMSSVLNMSSIIIIGDKLSTSKPLTKEQGVLVLRAFTTCVFWSPFFASMGVVLTSSPGAEMHMIILFGLPVAMISLLFSCWQIRANERTSNLEGYPINLESIWMPLTLASLVLIIHELFPEFSIVSVVTFTSITFTCVWLLLFKGKQGLMMTKMHIEKGIAKSGAEVVLFAASAMLASGISTVLTLLNIQLDVSNFTVYLASITMLVQILLSLIGVHPFAGVILAGSVLSTTVKDPNFLGLTLIMGCALSMSISPYAGVQITIKSRYGISVEDLMKSNLKFVIFMFCGCILTLWLYNIIFY